MGSDWRPNDELLDRDKVTGKLVGTERVKDALREHRIPFPDRVLTSRDDRMDDVRNDLKKESRLPRVQQWQMPILIDEEEIWVEAHHESTAEIPPHSHEGWVLHIVITGVLQYEDRTLNPGDWILVPPGKTYSLKVVAGNPITCYVHKPIPIPQPIPEPKKPGSG